MKNSFSVLQQNILTRRFGGTTAGVADPYVSGYGFLWPLRLPTSLEKFINSEAIPSDSKLTNKEIQMLLCASCLSVTPPGGTVNKVEYTGLGGLKWAVPGNVDYGNSLSVKFLEFSGLPILNVFHRWCKLIRDLRTGVSNLLTASEGGEYTKSSYSAVFLYWTTKPNAKDIEFYAMYDGVFPTKDPMDLYTFDIESVDKLEVEIEFNVDYIWTDSYVYDLCVKAAEDLLVARKTISKYEEVYKR
jgi:hypothetical protein